MWAWNSREKLKVRDEHLKRLCSVVAPEARDQERSSVKCQRVEGCGVWSSRLHVRGTCLLPMGSPHPRSSMPSLSRGLGMMSYARTFCIVLFLMKWYPGVLINYFHSGLLLCDVLLHRKQKVAGEGFRSDLGTWVSMVTGQYCVNGAWKQILVLYFMGFWVSHWWASSSLTSKSVQDKMVEEEQMVSPRGLLTVETDKYLRGECWGGGL